MARAPGVLMTGARAPITLDLARRFHAAGWRVHVADSLPAHSTGSSRAVTQRHRLAPPRQALAAFAHDLSRIAREHAIDLLLPTCEEALYVAHVRPQLPAQLSVACSEFALMRQLHSKWEFLQLARDCGVGVPDSARVQILDEARDLCGHAPVVLKPEFSRFGTFVRVLPGGITATTPPLAGHGPWVAQQLVRGSEYCSYVVAMRGRLLAHAVYAPRYRLRRSASYYFDPVTRPALQAFAATLVGKLGYTGQIAFDWIIDDAGTPWVLECNPRGTSGVHLFAPHDPLPAALAGQREGVLTPGHGRAAMLGALMWLEALPRALLQGALPAWRVDMARADDVLAVPGDRAPLPMVVADLAAIAGTALRQRTSLRAAATADCEWDGDPLAP
ncbi:ATP-grasp domain-containing protein [Pseudoxanthomonas sp. JBR18]|uniref:ATP-grasp domain-containing protein n=1 Tax=Pseudoxanthomonas sp. JBR18 TaxID=2969308 RepID=UPI00230583AC|nr:ATP-grasp domain-containing protein [Pseudoxanthomonas sp. JBR18]WCE05690.1 ATP-grasp domain-containing protein [Pseudoxanthomonas sp. JBR18]